MTTISAKSILRTKSVEGGPTLSTLLLRYPRWVHAEFMTHRAFSRNAASSRAIPVEKLIADIESDPAVPLFWGKNQKGMQAGEEHDAQVASAYSTDSHSYRSRESAWMQACKAAVWSARAFSFAGYHKQIVNRLLEPFAHITVLCSATDWNNFLALRDHPDAEPHIQMLARAIRQELETAPIQVLEPGYWHLPFVTQSDIANLAGSTFTVGHRTFPVTIKKSVACCASTSYKTVDGFDMSLERATALHDRLLSSTPLHASPAEHVAQVDEIMLHGTHQIGWMHQVEHGNFTGFRQYRKMLPHEAVLG